MAAQADVDNPAQNRYKIRGMSERALNPAKLEAWQADPAGVDPRYRDSSVNHVFARACRKAGVANATFHGLQHTFVTNARRAGIDYFRIMAITGHKTMTVFKPAQHGGRSGLAAGHAADGHLYGHQLLGFLPSIEPTP
jgi:hypothetical protein